MPTLRRAILIGPSIDLQKSAQKKLLANQLRALKPRPSDLLIGVDGGIELAATLMLPLHVAIGDWDSARTSTVHALRRSGTAVITLPTKKDKSDLAMALALLAEFPISEITLLGFSGGRADHHLSNLLEIASFAAMRHPKKHFQKIAAFGPEAEYHFLTHQQATIGSEAGEGPAFRYSRWRVTLKA